MLTKEEIEKTLGVKIERLIKSTLFSSIYEGRMGERKVAIKVPKINPYETLSEELIRSFDREIEIWSKLKHENIVELLKFARCMGFRFL